MDTRTMRILLAALLLSFVGCTDADLSGISGYGTQYRVTLYTDAGAVIRQWTSTGIVKELDGGTWWFRDLATGAGVGVRGNLTCEQLPENPVSSK